jgi:hypothetical protein
MSEKLSILLSDEEAEERRRKAEVAIETIT